MNSSTAENLDTDLQARDEIIAALTAQLEETVEKLDRLQRSSGDRPHGGHSNSTAHSSELIGRLEEALDVWNEQQPAERLARIEEGIEQILSCLASGENDHPEVNAQDYWQAAKAKLLGEEVDSATRIENEDHSIEAPPRKAVPPAEVESTLSHSAEETLPEILPEAPEPQPVPEGADADQLWEGIEARETYIRYLISRVRYAESRYVQPVPWEELSQSPEELKRRLLELEGQLTAQLKQAEISNSLERAALTRERSKLYQVKQQLEKQVHQLKVTSSALPVEEPQGTERKDRRWNRFFS